MNSVVVLIIGFIVFFIGYRFYAKYVDTKIIKSDPNRATPAKMFMDGVEFMPTSKNILFGYQFKSIAGAAPVIGPIIAIQWGWLPAFIWVVIGTTFFAGVHDFGALWFSVRNRARSVGSITGDVVGLRARNLFMIVIFLWIAFWEVGGQNIPNDLVDMEEDGRLGAKTVPVVYGPNAAVVIALATLIAGFVLGLGLVFLSPLQQKGVYVLGGILSGAFFLLLPLRRLIQDRDTSKAINLALNCI